MKKHEEARKHLIKLGNILSNYVEQPDELIDIEQYINSCEATEKAYEELKRDVKRYFYLLSIYFNKATNDEVKEYAQLKDKLSKVGDSNE